MVGVFVVRFAGLIYRENSGCRFLFAGMTVRN